ALARRLPRGPGAARHPRDEPRGGRRDPRLPGRDLEIAATQGARPDARAPRSGAGRRARGAARDGQVMRCADVERLVTEYVDGELDERRSSALRGHLRVCTGCAARVEDEVAVRETAGSLAPLDPPADLWAAIDTRLAEAEIADARRSRVWLWWQR